MKRYILLVTIIFTHFSVFAGIVPLDSIIDVNYTIKSTDYGIHKSTTDVTIDNTNLNNPIFDVRLDFSYDSLDPTNSNYVIVEGDLIIDENSELNIEQGVLFIVEGDVIILGDISFKNQGYFVVMGSVIGSGTVDTGSGIIATPAYIGGSIDSTISVVGDGSSDTPLNITEPEVRAILDYEISGWENDLPVELVSFTAHIINNNIVLKWSTATEINASHFSIEKSTDKTNWDNIGKVEANGNSTTTIEYQFIDYNTIQTSTYYRLVQEDFDGQTEIFGPILVNGSSSNSNISVHLFPNPSYNKLNLQLNNVKLEKSLEFVIIDKLGKVVYKEIIQPTDPSLLINLKEKGNLHNGTYFLIISSGMESITSRFVIH
ncbi:T9SS type A sorting domain-containing protein [Flammeovirga sp. MY04]|uniref:T9SS type A sorting domain-containing protein n=1 Tax=Flammeovirga sp. MY04 TaxID=1191459 RepID=UPI0008061344|nr:T9SS type A sorting domain-containing protein [Flammeovirga sp. MY04]ANQ51280.1 T9SS type A sorting domain-containing protein [Flammeovirga sp. MY04]